MTAWLMTRTLVPGSSACQLARLFAPMLIPIAVAYHIADNFSSVRIQGQNTVHLLSDPFGRQRGLFGRQRGLFGTHSLLVIAEPMVEFTPVEAPTR